MDESNIYQFCCGLIFWNKAEFMQHKYYRTLKELQHSVETTTCPFCKAFYVSLSAERPNTKADTRCKFSLDTHHGGFIQLTILFCCSLLGAQDSNKVVKDWDDSGMDKYLENICHWMIAYAETERPEAWERFHNRPDWQPRIMDITTRFDSIDQWLKGCVSHRHGSHKTCFDIKIPGYPSRLLNIDRFETSGQVRLVDNKDLQQPLPEYTTLSHCWGPPTGPRPLTTVSGNLESHKTGIPMKDLPKTFQDAVKITHRIGKKFLWIDSLAIIQDDLKDWESEAARMAAIYENSFLTITATTSENCQGGCDLEPWDLCIIKGRARTGPGEFRNIVSETQYQMKLKRTNASWKGARTRLPLHTRGWVLQEAVLSRRILHMASHHMLWQCREQFDYEDANVRMSGQGGVPKDLADVGFLLGQFENKYDHTWWLLANSYSQLSLTKSTDKLPAVAGIVQFHAAKLHDIPLLGLWKMTLALDLGWRCKKPQAFTIPGIPTWTWLSSLGEITGPIGLVPDANGQLLADASINWEREAYVSKLEKDTLKVKSKIFEATLKENTKSNDPIRENFREVLMQPFSDDVIAKSRCILEYHSDIVMTGDTSKGIKLAYLLLYTYKSPQHERLEKSEYIVFLALRPAPDDPSAYVRIGCGAASVRSMAEEEPEANSGWPGFGFIDHVLKDWEDATIQLC